MSTKMFKPAPPAEANNRACPFQFSSVLLSSAYVLHLLICSFVPTDRRAVHTVMHSYAHILRSRKPAQIHKHRRGLQQISVRVGPAEGK